MRRIIAAFALTAAALGVAAAPAAAAVAAPPEWCEFLSPGTEQWYLNGCAG